MRTVATVVLGLALALSGGIIEVLPAGAATVSRVTLKAPVVRADGTTTLLRGRVVGRTRTVRVEVRKASTSWKLLTRTRVRRGSYSVRVRFPAGTRAVRVGVRGHYSAARKVVTAKPAPTPPTVAPRPQPSDACGPQPVKADGSLWSCTFVDDFAGTSLDRTKWTVATSFITGSPDVFACAVDDPSVVGVSDGNLNLSVRRVDTPVPCEIVTPGATTPYIAGTVSTAGWFSQKYGRFEARLRNTATDMPGLAEAFWMWPVDEGGQSWPDSGEIDITETYSTYSELAFPYLHSSADSGGSVHGFNTAWDCAAQRGVWNTFALEWSATQIEFFVNGRSCLVNRAADPAFQKAYIPILTQALGASWNEYDGRAPLPATLNVDYIRVWQ